ncbi:MAG: hypothetical protein ACYC27_16080 [Armatimonadota bacterium]
MIKVKNVQSGIVIIADAGIKMGPGDVVEVNSLTPQALKAIDDGLITRVDMEPESKQKAKMTAKADEQAGSSSNKQPAELKLESQPAVKPESQSVKVDLGDKNGAG